jgi:polyphosphate kinase 2 (PPK2 family)
MLETVDLSLELSKEEHKKLAPPLRERLRLLQYQCKDAEIPIVIVFEGWDASGKGLVISRLLERIDPRGFTVYPARPPTPEEEAMPFLWRYWIRLPGDGEIALFDRSWYGRLMIERVGKLVKKKIWRKAFEEIAQFERQLADDGTLLVKCFLHISRKEQKRRLTKLENDKFESWRVTKWDWQHHKDYDKYVTAIEEMLARTEAPHAPWTIVEATDKRHAEIKVFQTLVKAMEDALEWRKTRGAEIGRSKLGREARARQAKPSPVPRKDSAEPGTAPSKPKTA